MYLGNGRGRARLVILTFLVAVLIIPLSGSTSSAHLPVFDTGGGSYETAERIDDLETSYAFYGELLSMDPGSSIGARYYVFEGAADMEFKFELGTRDFFFAPCILLTGPGLPSPDEDAQNIIRSNNLTIPDGYGAVGWSYVFLPWVGYFAESEFEPFTQTTFFYSYEERVILPSDGTYYLILTGVVYSDELEDYQIASGKYFLVTGYEERFTLADFVLMPWYWMKVQSFWDQHGGILFISPTAGILVGLLAAEWWVRRKDEAFMKEARFRKYLYFGGLAGSSLMVGAAVNQLSLLAIHSSGHDWEGIVLLVVALQLGGFVIGLASIGLVKSRFYRMNATTLSAALAVAILALVLGAGLIVGPLLFISSLALVMIAGRRTGGTGHEE